METPNLYLGGLYLLSSITRATWYHLSSEALKLELTHRLSSGLVATVFAGAVHKHCRGSSSCWCRFYNLYPCVAQTLLLARQTSPVAMPLYIWLLHSRILHGYRANIFSAISTLPVATTHRICTSDAPPPASPLAAGLSLSFTIDGAHARQEMK